MAGTHSEGSDFWRRQTVVVTGGAGFLGSHVVDRLVRAGCEQIVVPRKADYDLTRQEATARLVGDTRPDLIIHLAAEVGGIGANQDRPGLFFYANMAMGLNLIEEARAAGVPRFVQIGTICAYPDLSTVPFREDELWSGYPEETNAPYGIAKKTLLVQLQAYRAQYGFDGIYLLPVNLYGPRDNFDPASSHVIPALIRKMVEARDNRLEQVEIWGTGSASREFLFVDECARAILLAAEHYRGREPINLGTGRDITIRDLANLIARIVGFEGRFVYDPSKPDGQRRRRLDTSRAEREFGFRARVSLDEGLRRTVDWYADLVGSEVTEVDRQLSHEETA